MKVNEGGGVAHEEENIDVMEMSYDEAYAMIASGEIKDAKTILYCSMLKLISSFKTIEFRNMNNQKKRCFIR
jgi:hypothetical protein